MNKTIVIGLILSAMTALAALITWMLPLVTEYPGVERPLENQLPAWFASNAPGTQPSSPHTKNESAGEPHDEDQKGEYVGYTIISGTTVEINEKEYKLEPNQIVLKVDSLPASITFVLHNQGHFSHDFEVLGHGLDIKAPKFGPGSTQELPVIFKEPGEYEIHCPLSNHAERGMHGTLVIQVQR